VVAWLQWDGDHNNVWANTYDAGTGWQTAEPTEHKPGDAADTQVATSPSCTHAMAVWSQLEDSMISNVRVNRHGTLWRAEATTVDLDNGWHAYAPQVVVYGSGAAKVVWLEQFRVQFRIWTNHFKPSVDPLQQRWWGAERIETDTDTADIPALVGYEGGGAMAVWHQVDGGGADNSVWANRWAPRDVD